MPDSGSLLPLNSQKPYIQFVVSMIVMLAVSLVLVLFNILLTNILFGTEIGSIDPSDPDITGRETGILKFIQSLQHISIFLIPSLVIGYLMTGKTFKFLTSDRKPELDLLVLSVLMMILIIPVTSYAGYLNSRMSFPEGLSGLYDWMRGKEDRALQLTSLLIEADNTSMLVINLLVLSLIPSLGEEFLFRGVFQRIFERWTSSGHMAVFITAFLFSATHLQFFGFLPRFILGLAFGYVFLWSRNIWYPVLAHFINNSIPVVLSYLRGWEELNSNVEDYSVSAGIISLIPLLGVIAILWYFRSRFFQARSS
jgi:membrane protease YdiL (CAAX protease family)